MSLYSKQVENKVVPTTPSPNKTIIIYRFNNIAVFTHYINVNLVYMNNTSYAQIYAEHSKELRVNFFGYPPFGRGTILLPLTSQYDPPLISKPVDSQAVFD